jgi:ketosteroid isomerase-like protein
MSQNAMQVCRRFFDEVCNARQLRSADALFAEGHVYHDPSSPWVGTGPQGMKDLVGAYHSAVNDARWEVKDMREAGDVVVTRWTGTGTHTGDLFGIAPTHRRVTVDGIWMQRVTGDRIAESWNAWDMLGLLQQLGVVPAVGAAPAANGHQNVAFVKHLYGLFLNADIPGLLGQFSDDISWETPGAPRMPYAGTFRGRQGVARFFDGLATTAEMQRFEPLEFVADGDRVIVFGEYGGKGRSTGRPFFTKWTMVFTIKDGKVTDFREYLDTGNLGAAFS